MVEPISDADYEILSVVLSWIVKCYHSTLFDVGGGQVLARVGERGHLVSQELQSIAIL